MSERLTESDLEQIVQKATKQVKIGTTYKHYKGNRYKVTEIGLLEATNEPCVIYQAVYNNKLIFVRPLSVWLETVEYQGKLGRRFSPE